ncbi:hypothetical protein AAMO2058_001636100 [Amorphochlora amoebiformis]
MVCPPVPLHNKFLVAILHNSQCGAPPAKRKRENEDKSRAALRRAARGARMRRGSLSSVDDRERGNDAVEYLSNGQIVHRDPAVPPYNPLKHIPMENLHTPEKYFSRFSQHADIDHHLIMGPFHPEPEISYSFCYNRQLPSFHAMRERLVTEANKHGINTVTDEAVAFVGKALERKISALIGQAFELSARRRLAGRAVRKTTFITSTPAALSDSFTNAMRKVANIPPSAVGYTAKSKLSNSPSLPNGDVKAKSQVLGTPEQPESQAMEVESKPRAKRQKGRKRGRKKKDKESIYEKEEVVWVPSDLKEVLPRTAKRSTRTKSVSTSSLTGPRDSLGLPIASSSEGSKTDSPELEQLHRKIIRSERNFASRPVSVHFEIAEDALDPETFPELKLLPAPARVKVEDLGKVLCRNDAALLGPGAPVMLERLRAAHVRS